MPKRKEELNPECGERLKLLLDEQKVTQKNFAEKLGYTEQHISQIIKGKRRLTVEMAQRITRELFPEYRYQWLLCMDNFKTEEEENNNIRQLWEEEDRIREFRSDIFRYFVEGIPDKDGHGLRFRKGKFSEPFITDPFIDEYIVASDRDGQEVGIIMRESFDLFRKKIESYTSYLVMELIRDDLQPCDGKEYFERWLTFKNAATKMEN